MQQGTFIWADLSTYHQKRSTAFYQSVFGWNMQDKSGYSVAHVEEEAIAGIYKTPAFFQKIKMPHFWMSYFQVESVEETVALANTLGAKVELETSFYEGKIALIRDPQGAGFTVYEGSALLFGEQSTGNTITQTELHVSNVGNVLPFYSKLFSWDLSEIDDRHYQVGNIKSDRAIEIRELNNSTKGNYEYWAITIGVKDLPSTSAQVEKNGGQLIFDENSKILFTDDSGEAFFYIEKSPSS